MKDLFYPKQINTKKISALENQCFFAMPFSEQYTNLYDTLVLYLENAGYKCIRVDNNLSASVPIINLILSGIASSQYVIVDISETNANVFYELGITHTVKDLENVFIIKEKSATTPFDIQHLQYIAYDKNNLKNLSIELLKRLKANQYKNSFRKAFSAKQLIKYNDADEFIDYFLKLFKENIIILYTTLLEEDTSVESLTNINIVNSIWEYDKVLRNEIKKKDSSNYISILFKLFYELLLSCSRIDEIQVYISEFLHTREYSKLYEDSLLPYQTDLAIKFAENGKLMDITVKWIVEYFQRSKSTKVDLNRYKLEAFLLKSNYDKVNEYLVNAVLSDNNYIREHIADIIGEKRLYIAEDNLITQLKREKNIYTTSSLVEALGKIGSKKSIETINDWLEINADEMIKNKNFFVLKHIRNAFIRIDQETALVNFDEKYYEILRKTNTI